MTDNAHTPTRRPAGFSGADVDGVGTPRARARNAGHRLATVAAIPHGCEGSPLPALLAIPMSEVYDEG
jgi:hypothetical protein